ncbi:response regulator transcription factor [Erythrobacter sp. KY5]|uniref:response regulator transcription factor n=1 Tax=Erythrobacter sp. KY5 TaxID=2011159 RepID=UPI0013A6E36B|nr:response regulator transcription factor [Erythrobacter sp. KY5]
MRVLVIEDNLDIQANIADYLEPEYLLDFAYNGEEGLKLACANDYDVIVLDLNLPRLDGIELCRRYKAEARLQAPILMLTARDTLDDKEDGFAAGADDYLTKPFALRELKMRIGALANRPRVINALELRFGDLVLDPSGQTATIGEASRRLSNMEADILKWLIQEAPNPVPGSTISYRIWGEDPPASGALRTHIYNLRRILSELRRGGGPAIAIATDRERGYRLCRDGER